MNDRNEAVDRLLKELEPADSAESDRYEAVLRAGLAGLKPGRRRARYIAVGLAGLVGCLVCGALAITEPTGTPRQIRWILSVFASFGLGWTLLAIWALGWSRGNFASERVIAARMALGFTLITVMVLCFTASLRGNEAASLPLVAIGLAFMILGAVVLIGARMTQAEQAIREQILRLECRIAGVAEANGRASEKRDGRGAAT
jgi:hypothetical protein